MIYCLKDGQISLVQGSNDRNVNWDKIFFCLESTRHTTSWMEYRKDQWRSDVSNMAKMSLPSLIPPLTTTWHLSKDRVFLWHL